MVTVMLVACAADPKLEPTATSHVEFKDVPASDPLRHTDLLFAIDNTMPMATLADELAVHMRQLADRVDAADIQTDVNLAVVLTTPTSASLVDDRVIHLLDRPVGGDRVDFAGSLADELGSLVPTTFMESSNQVLSQITAAVEQHPEFRRRDARLLIVPITNRDDESPDPVDSYRARIAATFDATELDGLLVIAPIAATAPRLIELAQRPIIPISDDDWTPALMLLAGKFILPASCFEGQLAVPFNCTFETILADNRTALAACDATASNRPCYSMPLDLANCTLGSHVSPKVLWAEWPVLGTRVVSQCQLDP